MTCKLHTYPDLWRTKSVTLSMVCSKCFSKHLPSCSSLSVSHFPTTGLHPSTAELKYTIPCVHKTNETQTHSLFLLPLLPPIFSHNLDAHYLPNSPSSQLLSLMNDTLPSFSLSSLSPLFSLKINYTCHPSFLFHPPFTHPLLLLQTPLLTTVV